VLSINFIFNISEIYSLSTQEAKLKYIFHTYCISNFSQIVQIGNTCILLQSPVAFVAVMVFGFAN